MNKKKALPINLFCYHCSNKDSNNGNKCNGGTNTSRNSSRCRDDWIKVMRMVLQIPHVALNPSLYLGEFGNHITLSNTMLLLDTISPSKWNLFTLNRDTTLLHYLHQLRSKTFLISYPSLTRQDNQQRS